VTREFRVRVEVAEPFELVEHTYDRVFVLGRVRDADSSRDELVIQTDDGSTWEVVPLRRSLPSRGTSATASISCLMPTS
jgi:hypothetical protein